MAVDEGFDAECEHADAGHRGEHERASAWADAAVHVRQRRHVEPREPHEHRELDRRGDAPATRVAVQQVGEALDGDDEDKVAEQLQPPDVLVPHGGLADRL